MAGRSGSDRLLLQGVPRIAFYSGGARCPEDITYPACLRAALERSTEAAHWTVLETPAGQDAEADACLTRRLAALRPDALASTCTLWNIERTLRVLALLKRRLPALKIVIGGPDIAANHPLLPGTGDARRATRDARFPSDAWVVGEGEAVFPEVLRFFRTGRAPDTQGVAWRAPDGAWRTGTRRRPVTRAEHLQRRDCQ